MFPLNYGMAIREKEAFPLGAARREIVMGYIDADAHVIESPETWAYIPEADKRYMPLLVNQVWGREVRAEHGRRAIEYWIMDNRFHARDQNINYDAKSESRELKDVAARLAHMDELGVDTQIIFPTVFLRPAVRTRAAERVLTRSYNRWLGGIWKQAPDRLRWVALPPILSLELARDELAWAKENGAVGVFLRGYEWDRCLGDSYFYPLYEIASSLDLPICVHTGNNSITQHDFFIEDTSFTKFIQPAVSAFHSLIEKEVPARFPSVRWSFVEAGAQWVPYCWHHLRRRLMRAKGQRLAKTFLADNNIFVACDPAEDIPYILEYAGEDHLVVGTDYGHNDAISNMNALVQLANRTDLSPAVIAKITETNARKLYAL
jgi:predicted TIM-barrel fold metal-dependent hydrolase